MHNPQVIAREPLIEPEELGDRYSQEILRDFPAGSLPYSLVYSYWTSLAAGSRDLSSGPKFRPEQQVSFAGGVGTIRNCTLGLETWIYTVEMEMGPEPEVGRLGPETSVLLDESEIQGGDL